MVKTLILNDFISEIPTKWKNIIIRNNYKITDIILPEDVDNWAVKRILAIRKGILFRSVEIDGDLIEKQYTLSV